MSGQQTIQMTMQITDFHVLCKSITRGEEANKMLFPTCTA